MACFHFDMILFKVLVTCLKLSKSFIGSLITASHTSAAAVHLKYFKILHLQRPNQDAIIDVLLFLFFIIKVPFAAVFLALILLVDNTLILVFFLFFFDYLQFIVLTKQALFLLLFLMILNFWGKYRCIW